MYAVKSSRSLLAVSSAAFAVLILLLGVLISLVVMVKGQAGVC